MRSLLVALQLGFLMLLTAINWAFACDPNENCYRCLVSAFNHCIQHGNDPVCEARKKACQTSPGATDFPISPFQPGGPLGRGGPAGITLPDIYSCAGNVNKCNELIAKGAYNVIAPIVNGYIAYLESQVRQWYILSPVEISQLQRFYSNDLHSIRFAFNINTRIGNNVTIGNEIFFQGFPQFHSNPNDAFLLFHEMEHTVQYKNRGGIEGFMTEYVFEDWREYAARVETRSIYMTTLILSAPQTQRLNKS